MLTIGFPKRLVLPTRRGGLSGVFCFVGLVVTVGCSDPLHAAGSSTGTTPTWTLAEFPISISNRANYITAGPDGNLWFTESVGNSIGRITLTGTVSEFPLPVASSPQGIAAGPDGNLWFTEFGSTPAPYSTLGGNNIGRITPTGTITEFPIPEPRSEPLDITAGPDGNLWFTESFGNRIGRITPTEPITGGQIPGLITPTGTVTEFNAGIASDGLPVSPTSITTGPDGNLWFTEDEGGCVGRISRTGGDLTKFSVPTADGGPVSIAAGPDGNLWFTEFWANNIGRITPSGTVTEFRIPTVSSQPAVITAGPDDNLWFTEEQANKIGRITPEGRVTEFPLPVASSYPLGITAGPDGNLWFTEAGKIGRITP